MDFSGIADTLSTSPFTAIPLLFLAGLLTSLTPCVYPMIPITVAIVGRDSLGASSGKWRPLALTLVYVTGLALVYALLGLIAGLTGTIFGTISSSPWLYFLQANVLLLAGLAMLDVFTISLPASTMEWASRVGGGGSYLPVFGMGAVSGLVAAPCSAPVMAAVLTWVTRTQSAVLGFLYLFVFSLGMCALLVAVGVSSGSAARLPRAGLWMVRVKKVFGLVMLGVAEYYLVKMGQVLL
ncbi:MAG: sulfite exporter TauE/SafE family protein [Gemmatimonadaceae bacterium]|nr:sulfite exporter TauE/SafE family protein [Gemmatimonadaceae bacterium]